jgi:Putative prokaryotic signal transducing protein
VAETPDVPEVVAVTAVPNSQEAEVVCGLLRSAGIQAGYRRANISAVPLGDGWREILVAEDEADAARELLAAQPVVDEPTGYY